MSFTRIFCRPKKRFTTEFSTADEIKKNLLHQNNAAKEEKNNNWEVTVDCDSGISSYVQYNTPSLFTPSEEEDIKNFFGDDMLISMHELLKIIHPDSKDSDNQKGWNEFKQLVHALRKTPSQRVGPEAANDDPKVKEITNAATDLKVALQLTDKWEQAKNWMYRIIGAIAGAAPCVTATIPLAGLITTVPILAPIVGVGILYASFQGYRLGNKMSNFFSPVRAKANHSETVDKLVKRATTTICGL